MVHDVVVAVGEDAALALRGIAGFHPLDEHDPEGRSVAEVDRHAAVLRDAAAGDRERPIGVERAQRGVRGHSAGRGEGPGGGGGGAGAAGEEGEGQDEVTHASLLQGGEPVDRKVDYGDGPGIRVFKQRSGLRRSKTRTPKISHDVKEYQK